MLPKTLDHRRLPQGNWNAHATGHTPRVNMRLKSLPFSATWSVFVRSAWRAMLASRNQVPGK
jgi:hypothetical protein